jgi:hypothetical protein
MKGRIGVENNGIQIVVTHVPGRRRPSLCIISDGECFPVASFTSEGRADFFLTAAQEFFGQKLQQASTEPDSSANKSLKKKAR